MRGPLNYLARTVDGGPTHAAMRIRRTARLCRRMKGSAVNRLGDRYVLRGNPRQIGNRDLAVVAAPFRLSGDDRAQFHRVGMSGGLKDFAAFARLRKTVDDKDVGPSHQS